MIQLQPELSWALLIIQGIAAIVGAFYFFRLKNSYWRWFCVYLIFIFIQEFFWRYNASIYSITKQAYYALVGIPAQVLFFIWLYGIKSLQNNKLSIGLAAVYLISLLVSDYLMKIDVFNVMNLNFGTILLIVLVVLEFLKQIKTENILKFYEDKMFYINLGVILFYVGTYPFFAFYNIIVSNFPEIWNMYYIYFLLSNCIMYLLFVASLLWGKQK